MQSGVAPSSAMSERYVGDGRLRLSGRFDAARMRPERRLARTTSGGVPRPAGRTTNAKM
jgi:hypothetical protein